MLSHYLDGGYAASTATCGSDIYNPSSGDVIACCPRASHDEIRMAVDTAERALSAWSGLGAVRRIRVLYKFRHLLAMRAVELARVLCHEQGKTLADGAAEIERGLEAVEHACAVGELSKGECSFGVARDLDTYSVREPVGLVAGITAFNFPVMLPLWVGATAVACGNAFINKPSELAPTAPLMLGELWSEAGLPAGIWNVLLGDGATARTLLEQPEVAAVSFVGSTTVGRDVYASACRLGKRAQAFCSAKNHMVILPDADPAEAARALVSAGFGAAGQRCMAISVAVPIGDRTADRVLECLIPRIEGLKIGPYDAPAVDLGPLITAGAKARVEGVIEDGLSTGARLLVDGRGVRVEGHEGGFFVGGTLFDHVTPAMRLHGTEIFGPVLSVVRASGLDEAIDVVNRHEYGNGVSIFTRDGAAARRFIQAVDVGMIGVNVAIPVPVSFYCFGGSKRSKFGEAGLNGPDGIRFVTRLKTVTARWRPEPTGAEHSLAMPGSV
jgi:malonate-semialdehyde dehydrogenase (acetylating)/methylmalonate-semialdehyde dehydrogenase